LKNQSDYHIKQISLFNQAVSLLENGEECGTIAGQLDPEYSLRLRIHTQLLPEEIKTQSLYGKAHAPAYKKKK
jgi:hypothetical protein